MNRIRRIVFSITLRGVASLRGTGADDPMGNPADTHCGGRVEPDAGDGGGKAAETVEASTARGGPTRQVWRGLASLVLAGLLGLPGWALASPGCQALNGQSGTLTSHQYIAFLTNDQPVNQGDIVTVSSSGTVEYIGSFINLSSSGGTVSGAEGGSGASADGIQNSTSGTTTFSITCRSVAPSVSGANPSSGSPGQTVTITGSGFYGASAVNFGGTPAGSFTVDSGTSITATVPNGTGTVAVGVTTDGGTATGGSFTFAAPTARSVNATVAFDSSNTPIALNTTGGLTSVAVTSGPAHGVAITNGTSITYTPTTGYVGSDSFTYTASNTVGTSPSATVTITVAPPAAPAAAAKTVSTAFNTATSIDLSSSITGVDIASLAVVSGPAHGTASVSGKTVTYTPAATFTGTDSFTYTATNPGGASSPATVTITVGAPAMPAAAPLSVSTPSGTAVSIDLAGSISGADIISVSVASAPVHGALSVSGETVTYTPAASFFGTDSFTYVANNAGSSSPPAKVTITVIALAVPTAAAQNATVLAGKAVTIHAAAGAGNGPFTGAAIVGPPASGTAVAQGTDIVYTAAADASGTQGFDYTLSNVFGASRPAHVTITIDPRPVAPDLSAAAVAGTTVQADLTAAARGGPFTAARVLAVSPADAGSATIRASANGYVLAFTAAPAFGGSARISYTLSNAFATSEPGTLTVAVTPRSDPSKDAEVLGVLEAQADAARRMATGQIGNFQRRLEMLHHGGTGGFSNGLTLDSAGSLPGPGTPANLRRSGQSWGDSYRMQPDAQAPPSGAARGGPADLPGGVSLWTGGAVNFGKTQPGSSDDGIDFTTAGVSVGADKRFGDRLAMGIGAGYGHDSSDVGQHGSHSIVSSYNLALYASYRPADAIYLDGLLGYQWLRFDARRYVTDDGSRVHGSRDGSQVFGSLSLGYEHRAAGVLLTPYGRLDVARARLDGYAETGDPIYALAYRRQTVKTSTGTLGLLAQWSLKRDYGLWAPQLRVEFGHDMQGASVAGMRYADLAGGPLYQATLPGQSRNHATLGAGIALQTLKGWLLRAEYQNYLDSTSRGNQSIQLGVQKPFGP